MRRYFVVIAPELTGEAATAFLSRIQGKLDWWHQIPGAWLIADDSGLASSPYLRGLVQELAPPIDCLVTEVQPKDWALRLSTDRLNDAGDWLDAQWLK